MMSYLLFIHIFFLFSIEKAKEEEQHTQSKTNSFETMQTDINFLSKEMSCIRQELRTTIELLCDLTNVPKESILCPEPAVMPSASTVKVNIENHNNMDSIQEEVTSDTLTPQSPKFTISTKDLEDITSETGISEVTPDDNGTDLCISEECSAKDSLEFEKVEPIADSASKMEEGECTGGSDIKESPGANKSPHISVIFEPNVKMKSPGNSTVDILQNRSDNARQENSGSGSSIPKPDSNSPLQLGLTGFLITGDGREIKQIVTETTDV